MHIKKIGYVSIAILAAALGLTLIIGYRPIPTMVPDMALRPSVQLDGAHGPLAALRKLLKRTM